MARREARVTTDSRTLVEIAQTLCKHFNVASNFYYEFLKLSRMFSCESISQFYPTFINLLGRSILVLAASLSLEVSIFVDIRFTSIYHLPLLDDVK